MIWNELNGFGIKSLRDNKNKNETFKYSGCIDRFGDRNVFNKICIVFCIVEQALLYNKIVSALWCVLY